MADTKASAAPVQQIPAAYFIDLETVPGCRIRQDGTVDFKPEVYEAYRKRFDKQINERADILMVDPAEATDIHYRENAGLYAEFGQIICISIGKIVNTDEGVRLRIKSLAMRHEKQLLLEFCNMISKATVLCSHNGKEFDYPFLFRRMMILGVPVPDILNPINKKPWEMKLEDTMEMWSGTQWKYRCSLDLLAQLFGLPSPKEKMNGADVAGIYYSMFDGVTDQELPFDREDAVLNKIAAYCNSDVFTLANVYCRMIGYNEILQGQIVYA